MKKRPTKSIVLQRNDDEKVVARIESGRVEIDRCTRRIGARGGKLVHRPGWVSDFEGGASLDFEAARKFAEWVLRVLPAATATAATKRG